MTENQTRALQPKLASEDLSPMGCLLRWHEGGTRIPLRYADYHAETLQPFDSEE